MPSASAVCCLSSVVVLLCGALTTTRLAAYSVDAGTGGDIFRKKVAEPFGITGRAIRWQRVRGLPNPETAGAEAIAKARDELRAIHARGVRSAVMLRFNGPSWANGVHSGSGQRMPLDLREAFERGRAYAQAYGDLVDAWEIDNEPDISFVEDNPEAYVAYFKAFGLGLRAADARGQTAEGRGLTAESGGQTDSSGRLTVDRRQTDEVEQRAGGAASPFGSAGSGRRWPVKPFFGGSSLPSDSTQVSGFRSQPSAAAPPLVLMAPLALPPGPWLEQGMRNDLLSYTDGFNYHYYGYAEDFTGVYRQFEDALTRVAREVDGEQWTVDGGGRKAEGGRQRAEGRRQRTEDGELRAEGGGPRSDRGSNQPSAISHLPSDDRVLTRSLPVFLTEYGYGSMSGAQAQTVDGRVRQWRWFADVLPQVRALRIEGPMAFVAMPYLEHGYNEFGLMMKAEASKKPETGNLKPELKAESKSLLGPNGGRKLLSAVGHLPSGSKPSSGFRSQVSGFTRRQSPAARPSVFAYGEGSLVLYNFSDETVTGRLELPEGFEVDSGQGTDGRQQTADGGRKAEVSRPTADRRNAPQGSEPNAIRSTSSGLKAEASRPHVEGVTFEAGGVVFAPEDFGATKVEPWMKRIGAPAKNADAVLASERWEASPAAAYLWDYAARHPYRSRPWKVRVAPPSPVVIDFLPGKGLQQYKAAGGYAVGGGMSLDGGQRADGGRQTDSSGPLTVDRRRTAESGGRTADARTRGEGAASPFTADGGSKQLSVISHQPSVSSQRPSAVGHQSSVRYQLPPGDRVVLPIRIRVQAERFELETADVRFVPEGDAQLVARWSARFVPQAAGMKSQVVARFDHPADAAEKARTLLLNRPLAREEPSLQPQGRWLVSEGVTVIADAMTGTAEVGGQRSEDRGQRAEGRGQRSEGGGQRADGGSNPTSDLRSPTSGSTNPSSDLWKFRIDAYAPMTLGTAMAELPLPEGFRFEPGTVLSLQYRLEAAAPTNPRRGHMLEVQVRTANGNLYQVWPRQRPTAKWQPYWQHTDNFTMGFFGRAALPWRFQDNEPVALVFYFRPGSLPATFEFTKVQLLRWAVEPSGNANLR